MDPLGDYEYDTAHRRVHNFEHDEMDMHMRARKAQPRKPGNAYPRVIIHVPEWLSKFAVLNRGLKLVLGGVVFVGCIGTYLIVSDLLQDKPHLTLGDPGFYAATAVDGDHSQGALPAPPGTSLPLSLSNLAEVSLPLIPSDVPFFLDLDGSGAFMISKMLGICAGFIRALDAPNYIRITESQFIEEVETENIGKILNVDTYSQHGIVEAIGKGLAWNENLDFMFSPFLYEASPIFSSSHRGRVFAVIRQPIERINTHFNALKANEDAFAAMSIEEYASSNEDRPEYNYFTKLFSNNLDKPSELLTNDDLNIAKEFLRRKVLIGLFSEKEESIRRFERFFNISFENLHIHKPHLCGEGLPAWAEYNPNGAPEIIDHDLAWSLLYAKNLFDIELYEYAQSLFNDQDNLLYNMQSLP